MKILNFLSKVLGICPSTGISKNDALTLEQLQKLDQTKIRTLVERVEILRIQSKYKNSLFLRTWFPSTLRQIEEL